jgi:hypothetical protein
MRNWTRVDADKGLAKVRAAMPLLLRWTLSYHIGSDLVDVDHVWTSARRWSQSPLALAPGWSLCRIGPFVLATRLRG